MIRINRSGYLYILLTLFIGFSAVNTGNNLVYIIASALLSYMLISGIFGRKNIRWLRCVLDFPREIFAGTELPVGVEITNTRKFMPAFLISVRVDDHEVLFPFVKPRSSARQYVTLHFEKRGKRVLKDITLSSVFPFNFFTRFKRVEAIHEFVIFPKPKACRATPPSQRRQRTRGENSSDEAGYDSDILSIRGYVTGDPTKYISWKSTAKTGLLMTKELSSIEQQPVMIDFDRMEQNDLEERISCVTFILLKLMRSNIPVGLLIDGEILKPGASVAHRMKFLQRLALYGEN